ncbi:diguanylate cyclase domain-containing protein [Comamonas nitrativorans]|uniref:Diguanylate cyclase domain-containing protein n=1 Tax=Comamonas nitrativorans TaxID=108437 RepID=A0ABV9GUF4_9BURK
MPRPGVRALVAALCAAIAFAALGLAWLGQHAFQTQWQQQQQAQQHLLLQTWSQQLALRLEAYQRALLGLAQFAQEQGAARLQQERVLTASFNTLFLAHPDGTVEQLAPQRQALIPLQPLPAAIQIVRQRALVQGGLVLYAQAVEGETVQLTWAQPLRDAQGQLVALLLAQAEIPQNLLLPMTAQFPAEVFGPFGFALRDAQTGILVRSLAPGNEVLPMQPEQALQLPYPQWRLESWAEAPAAPPSLWLWHLLLPGVVALCLVVGYFLHRQLLRWQSVRQAAVALSASGGATQWAAFLQASPAAMWVVQGPTIQVANAHAYTLLGYAPQFLEGVWLHYVVRELAQLTAVQHGVRTAGRYHGQVQLRKADGQTVLTEVSAYRLQDAPEAAVWQLWAPWSQLPLPTALPQAGLVPQDVLLYWLQSCRQPWLDAAAEQAGPATGALLFVDIDCLGALNETAGRPFGDHVLATVGRMLLHSVLPVGRAAYLGGDEFAALLPSIGVHHALLIGQRLCQQVQDWQPQWQGEPYWVSISVGVVAWDVRTHDGPGILRAADMACYQAKRKGKAQVVVGTV